MKEIFDRGILVFIAGSIAFVSSACVMVAFTKPDAGREWCRDHKMEPFNGYNEGTMCFDPKTRLVYKPVRGD